MQQTFGFTTPPEEHWKYCPYCMNPLGKVEIIKRKTKRIAVCKKCKKMIDDMGKMIQVFLDTLGKRKISIVACGANYRQGEPDGRKGYK